MHATRQQMTDRWRWCGCLHPFVRRSSGLFTLQLGWFGDQGNLVTLQLGWSRQMYKAIYDVVSVSSKLFNGRHFLVPSSASRNRMIFLDTAGILEGSKWRQIYPSSLFGWKRCHSYNFAILALICNSVAFWPPTIVNFSFRHSLLPTLSIYFQLWAIWRLTCLVDQPASLKLTIHFLLLANNCLYCCRLHFRGISNHETVHPNHYIRLKKP